MLVLSFALKSVALRKASCHEDNGWQGTNIGQQPHGLSFKALPSFSI